MHDLNLYIRKMLTNRDMVNFQKLDFFSVFLYTFTLNCVTTGARKCLLRIFFCFISSEQCIKIISLRKKCGFISSVFKKSIPNNLNPHFLSMA